MKKFIRKSLPVVAVLGMTGASALATDVAPLDLSATGATIAGYIATAAAAGTAILGGLYGLRIIIRAFKTVK